MIAKTADRHTFGVPYVKINSTTQKNAKHMYNIFYTRLTNVFDYFLIISKLITSKENFSSKRRIIKVPTRTLSKPVPSIPKNNR